MDKKCSRCGETKPLGEFHKRAASPDGFRPACKACQKKTNREHYLANRERVLQTVEAYRKNNPDSYKTYRRELQRRKEAEDVNFRLRRRLRTRVYHALKGYQKPETTMDLIGCTLAELRTFLEAQFETGMTWENYGQWHVDHIYPLAFIDLTDESKRRAAFNYLNLRPLWGGENMSNGGKMPSTPS